jgi:replicative DNA helicase|tara:strand:- start:161 stop:1639 length:1479 start_codon:yes stop_codon:yes gene_type:complete
MVRDQKDKRKLEDLAAERAVLSGLCQYGLDALLESDYLEAEHFTDATNQMLFKCVKKSLQDVNKVELSSILSAANQLGFYENINNQEEVGFLRSLFNFPIHKENVGFHAAKLAKLQIARDVKKTLAVCSTRIDKITGDEDINDIISIIETPVLDATAKIYQRSDNKPEVIGNEVADYVEFLSENKSDMLGISTGFPIYDEAIGGGLRRKCVDLIAARPKVGKSMFGDAVAMHVSKNLDIPVLVLDTEMSKEDHLNRMLANISGVEINTISSGKFADNELNLEKVEMAAKQLEEIPYHYVSIAGQPFENILSIMRKWIYQEVGFDETGRTKDCLIVYDYLKLMNSDSISNSMQEFQVLGFQITQLHNFCVKYDVPCLSFVQLNRDGITKESTDVVSGSDRLIWLCTSFSIFKMKSDEEIADDDEDNGNRKLVPIVARHGAGLDDGDYINMNMFGKFGKLVEGETRNALRKNSTVRDKGFVSEDGEQPTNIEDL